MKTNIQKWRRYFFCQCQWIRFTAAAIWCVFFAATGPKAHSQSTSLSTNSSPDTASETSTNSLNSTNEIELPQPAVSSSQPASGLMAYPAPVWPGQTVSNSAAGAMAYPAEAASASSSKSSSGVMAWPAPAWPSQTNSTSGAMAYPASIAPESLSSKASGVMAYPAPAWPAQTNATPAAEQSIPAPAASAPAPTPPPSAPVAEQPAAAAPTPAATTESATPPPPPAPEAVPTPPPAPAVSAEQPTPPPPSAPATEQPAAPTMEQAPAPSEGFSMAPPMLMPPKSTKNEVSASFDFLYGEGKVSLPLGYSLNKAYNTSGAAIPVGVITVPRNSLYYGATISYSYGQAWYLDLSIAQGDSSGNQSIPTGRFGALDSSFSIDDTWYQLYLKYTFPQLRGKRFSAYLRGGASYITATLNDNGGNGTYTQNDKTDDILGNIGAGLAYNLLATRHHLRVDLQGEVEGFGGERTQKSLETLEDAGGLTPESVNLDNTIYGGIGIATLRFEDSFGKTGLFKIFGEAGIEGRYTLIEYSGGGGTPSEYLWGPYMKLGLRYDF